MDASNYLKRHGWKGSGHSLDHTGRGLKKPLLVSKKVDVLGVGLNKHAAVSDQWWLRAFDQGLKTFGTGQESALAQAQKHGVNRGGLYGRFVKGEGVPGTLGQTLVPADTKQPPAQVRGVAVEGNGALLTPNDSDAQEERKERKRKRDGKNGEGRTKRKRDEKKDVSKLAEESEEKPAKRVKKEVKKASKATKEKSKSKSKSATPAETSGAEDELDPEKRALYTKRAAEKGVSLETYIKRRQEKYAAKKDEMRK